MSQTISLPKFVLTNIPMPPSSNAQYAAMAIRGGEGRWFGKIRPTKALENYHEEFNKWRMINNIAVGKARVFIRDNLLKDKMLSVDTYCCFPHSDMWTIKSTVKKMDASNRLKALHDCLSDVLQIDDSWFWKSSVEKLETKTENPWCFVVIKPVTVRSVRDIKQADL